MADPVALHVLVFDSTTERILVQRGGDRWIAPVIVCEGASVQYVPTLPARLSRLGITAWPVHDAALPDQVSAVRQRYCAFIVTSLKTTCREEWMALDLATRMPAVLDVQRTALATCIARFLHPVAPLDTAPLAKAPETWAHATLATRGYTVSGEPRVLKHKRDRRILVFPTTRGKVYLKVSAHVVQEAHVANALADEFPDQFVRTINLEPTRRWWVYEGIPGDALLTVDRLTPQTSRRIGTAVARIQHRSTVNARIREVLKNAQVTVRDLLAVADLAEGLVQRYATTHATLAPLHTPSGWHTIRRACLALGDLPSSYLHGDLWLPNIVERREGVGFIDLFPSLWGPSVLCWWPLISRLGPRSRHLAQQIVDSYLCDWPNRLVADQFKGAVRDLGMTGRLLQLKLGLDARRLGPVDYRRLAKEGPPTASLVTTLRELLVAAMASMPPEGDEPRDQRQVAPDASQATALRQRLDS